MRKKTILLICSLFVCSCHYSGHLVEKQEAATIPGTVANRGGTVPYRNDSHSTTRKDDALRKIAKFCGPGGYTITREGTSPTASDLTEIDFRCSGGEGSAASAPAGTPAPQNPGTSNGKNTKANPKIEPPP